MQSVNPSPKSVVSQRDRKADYNVRQKEVIDYLKGFEKANTPWTEVLILSWMCVCVFVPACLTGAEVSTHNYISST